MNLRTRRRYIPPVNRNIHQLEAIANELRCLALRAIYLAGSGHPGGSLSAAEIVTALYFSVLNIDPACPDWPERDRVVLSKGHGCPILYAALAKRGYFPLEELWTLRKLGSRLQGHPDMRKTPGIDATTGSLGQGISVAVGMALGGKFQGKSYRVYAIMGCGEQQEGQVWEAAMSAAHYCLDNLVGIVDYNTLQIDGCNAEIMEIAPLSDKWRAFGWHVLEVNGHDIAQLLDAFAEAKNTRGKPTAIIARTIKGKGVSFMENQVKWHSSILTKEHFEQAMTELGCDGYFAAACKETSHV
ncbi:MAG: transketolase [Ardenticatenia bacterium]|nr:MAG: transketolase [Ardenticatenia bacterium]